MVAILMIAAKLATLGHLKWKVFWSKGYEVIIFIHNFPNKTLSHELNYIADVAMWPNWGLLLVQVQQFGICTRYGLEILHRCRKKG